MDKRFEETLGRLIRNLKSVASVPADLEGLLAKALKRRNFLTHHFFRERAEMFMSREGREKMIEDLKSAQQLFDAADERLTQVATPLREKYGLSDERLQPFMDEYFKKIENDL